MTPKETMLSPHICVWNVAFFDRDRSSWWDWLTETGWRHVAAYGYCAAVDRWLVIDPADTLMQVMVLDDDGFDAWLTEKWGRCTKVVQKAVCESRTIRTRLGVTCVSTIKLLLGLDSGALRPKALYRDLLAQGGKTVFGDDHEPSERQLHGDGPEQRDTASGSGDRLPVL